MDVTPGRKGDKEDCNDDPSQLPSPPLDSPLPQKLKVLHLLESTRPVRKQADHMEAQGQDIWPQGRRAFVANPSVLVILQGGHHHQEEEVERGGGSSTR